jgi:hypothetical protein
MKYIALFSCPVTNATKKYVTSDLAFISHRKKSDLKVYVKGEEQVIPLFHYEV